MTMWRQGVRTRSWWLAAALGAVLCAVDLYGHARDGLLDGHDALFFTAMGAGMAVGLWVWAWRPKTHTGPLMFWWAALWLAADVDVPYPSSRLAVTVGLALFTIGPIVF